MLPTSLYIHIPWCIRKCPYCDFNSHKSPENLPEEQYVQALIADFAEDLACFPVTQLHSIFIGGGTPSLFSAKAYAVLFQELQKLIHFPSQMEITLEANPGTVEQQRFNDYRQLGINRLSLGIQSFNPIHLKSLGRIHDDKQAHTAIETARKAGFDNINIDIMHGLPKQTPEEGLEDLQQALHYSPEHLSWYQLTIEPNTVFYKKPPTMPDEEDVSQLEEEGFAYLATKGYQRYEISAFCQPFKEARHNLNYWLFGDYFGIGAGAHGKITSEEKRYRTRKHTQPKDYLNPDKPFLAAKDRVDENSLLFEYMLNATRLERKHEYQSFTERTGLSLDFFKLKLHSAAQSGLIEMQDRTWQVTPLGRRYTNNLQGLFLPE